MTGKKSTSQKHYTPRQDVLRTLPVGTIIPAFYIVLAWIYQPNLWGAFRHGWPLIVVIFCASALTAALPRWWSLGSVFAIFLVAAWFSSKTAFGGFTLLMFVLAGFFFGICVRSLLFQAKRAKKPARTS